MLYVFHGTDETSARAKAQLLINGLRAKAPDAEYIHLSEGDNYDIEELLTTQGLFKSNYIVLFDGFAPQERLDELKESTHVFVLLLGKVDAKSKQVLEAQADKCTQYSLEKGSERANVFGIANALKARDRQKLWITLGELRLLGISGEEQIGILFWAVKDMLLKGVHPQWHEHELKALARDLAALPHTARHAAKSVYNALEHKALML